MKYLITSSLLDSYDWLKTCPYNWRERAKEEFVSAIRREQRPVPVACQRGIDFERLVCDNCNNSDEESFKNKIRQFYSKKGVDELNVELAIQPTMRIAELCKNGKQQVAITKDIVIGNDEYHLFGYADIVLPNKIIDIKTTGKYKGEVSYIKRSQHYLYSLCTGIKTFEYLVADFKESDAPKEVHDIEFSLDENECLYVLEKRIKEMIRYIKENDLFEDYCEIFTKKHNENRENK